MPVERKDVNQLLVLDTKRRLTKIEGFMSSRAEFKQLYQMTIEDNQDGALQE